MVAWELILIVALINSDGPVIPNADSPVTNGSAREPVSGSPTPVIKTSWHTNFEEAQKEAKETGLPLVVHFYADWCGPCQSMEQSVLNSVDLKQQFGKAIVGVKINSDQQGALTQRLRVTALPTDVYLDPNGRELGRSVGSKGKAEYIAAVTALKNKVEQRPSAIRTTEIQVAALAPSGVAASRPAETAASPTPVTTNETNSNSLPLIPDVCVIHFARQGRDPGRWGQVWLHGPIKLFRVQAHQVRAQSIAKLGIGSESPNGFCKTCCRAPIH